MVVQTSTMQANASYVKSQGFVSQRDCISYSDYFQALDEAEASHILIHFKDGAGSRKFKGLYAFVPDTNEVSRGGATMREEGSRLCAFMCEIDAHCTYVCVCRLARYMEQGLAW